MNRGYKSKNSTLMKKLVKYFLVVIIIMFSLNIYSVYGFKSFYKNFSTMLNQLVTINSITLEMDELHKDISNYAHSGSKLYLAKYESKFKHLNSQIKLLGTNKSEGFRYKLNDIQNMVKTFNEKNLYIIKMYDFKTSQIYINQLLAESLRFKEYAQNEMKNLLFMELINIQSYYSGFNPRINDAEVLMYALTVLVTIVCIVIAFKFSRAISLPIHQLVLRLENVARGKLEIYDIHAKTNDEIAILINSFNHMVIQIKSLIEKIKEKATIENKLKEQEIKNLQTLNLLNKSELNFLQSQINPHFLFNTMNTIAILAQIEEAPQTKKMIESISEILRYNLKRLNNIVALREEYEVISNYIYIQRARFGNRIEYILDIDENAMTYKIPSMILQPFIENAIIHGLEPKEGRGLLELGIYDRNDYIEILIKDNGIGICEEKLKLLLSNELHENFNSKTGIGIANVVRRLYIIFGRNVVDIKSQVNTGTEVKISLPKNIVV